MEEPNYRLYVVRPEDIGEQEKYFLITPEWSLLYTANRPPKRREEIKDTDRLPALARRWLDETAEQIRNDFLRDHEAEILREARDFNTLLEQELRAEQVRLDEGKEQTDG